MINEHMHKLAQELELPEEFTRDRGGKYTFPMNEDTMITLNDIPPGFNLFVNICKVPEKDLETFYQHVLHGNLLGQGTSGGVMGLTEDGKNLTLSLDIDYVVTYSEFKDIIEEFFNTVDYWKEESQMLRAGKKLK